MIMDRSLGGRGGGIQSALNTSMIMDRSLGEKGWGIQSVLNNSVIMDRSLEGRWGGGGGDYCQRDHGQIIGERGGEYSQYLTPA